MMAPLLTKDQMEAPTLVILRDNLSNVKRFGQFGLVYPISATPSPQLGASQIVELLSIGDRLGMKFHQKRAERASRSVRELMGRRKNPLSVELVEEELFKEETDSI